MNILTNESTKTSEYFSRYNGVAQYYNKHDKKYQLALKAWLKKDFDSVPYVVEKGDTFDFLALKFYNNPTYYWLICDANDIINPMKEPEEGDVLLIPALGSDIQFEVY